MERMFMIRAGTNGIIFDQFKEKNIVAIGWKLIGDLSQYKTLDEIKNIVEEKYTGYKKQAIAMNAGQIRRFLLDIQLNDYVVTYNPEERYYIIGNIISDYYYDNSIEDYPNTRKVAWKGKAYRDLLSTTTKNALGSIATLFEITNEAKEQLLKILNVEVTPIINSSAIDVNDGVTINTIKEDFEEKAHEFIKDKILSLSWEDMQDLVAALIRALGFKTKVSQYGPDRGKDIIGSPDGLGLEKPRIIVEVKHRQGQMGSQEIRSFLGAFRHNTGIYVSTGGFTKDAKYEAERAAHPITLIDADYLVDLIVQNYDNFDIDGRTLVPLKKLYWPL
jgi:restriction system protein